MTTNKGFIKDHLGNYLLPITRAELILDQDGKQAFHSSHLAAQPVTQTSKGRYGLISPLDLALLKTLEGTESGNGTIASILADIAKLYAIQIGDGTSYVPFYDNSKTLQHINIIGGTGITSTIDGTSIKIGLAPVNTDNVNVTGGLLSSLTYDEYGRITGASSTSDLSGYTVNSISENAPDTTIVNKGYVDTLFGGALNVATGALNFSGRIASSAERSETYFEDLLGVANEGSYFIAVDSGSIPGSQVHYTADQDASFIAGDTLIVYTLSNDKRFVIVPSGNDETIATLISAKQGNTSLLNNATGTVLLQFGENGFNVTSQNNNTLNISLNTLTSESSDNLYGIISGADYKRFSQAASKSVSYVPEFSQGANTYTIGTLTFDNQEQAILGKDTKYTLSVTSSNNETEGILDDDYVMLTLSSTDTAEAGINIPLKGSGIKITNEDNALKFTPNLVSDPESANYLEINGSVIKIKKGSVTQNEDDSYIVNSGVVDYNEFFNWCSAANTTYLQYTYINNSLTLPSPWTEDGKSYYYGSNAMREAVNITI